MTKIAYLECPTGIAGDMCLGALIHAGVPIEFLITHLNQLGIAQDFALRVETVLRNGQAATKLHVELLKSTEQGHGGDREAGVDPHFTFAHNASSTASSPTHHPAGHSHEHHHGHEHGHSHNPKHSHHPDHPHAHDHGHHPDAAHLPSGAEAGPSSHSHPQGRCLADIETMIGNGHLPPRAQAWSLAIFRQLAEAEAAVHGMTADTIHFHEVGATDAIVDIVGTCLGLDWLEIDELYCSALPVGGGTIWAAHGRLPVPTPAVLKLFELGQVPVYSNGIERELVTPTGAAIATTLATDFGAPPPMVLHRVGLGAGARDLQIPNILRLWIGDRRESSAGHTKTAHSTQAHPRSGIPGLTPSTTAPAIAKASAPDATPQTVAVLETQIDDLSPQAIAYTTQLLLSQGALDVFTQPVTMKKSRLGTLITVICLPEQAKACEQTLFQETTTLGIRRSMQQRTILERSIDMVETAYGAVRIKVAHDPSTGSLLNIHPEYDDCAQLAQQHQVAWQTVHQTALQAWHQQKAATSRI
ncbi:nickel pincer cofactor biosynthesis protein LarC [Leptolyngbya sp. AN02str]|uniref:nickel pincer cofactor biosynthesis protein LarC n=1 Tax=Leptolyngbya sp. AN02str TaxID=3423363 RepID=UPI003D31332C